MRANPPQAFQAVYTLQVSLQSGSASVLTEDIPRMASWDISRVIISGSASPRRLRDTVPQPQAIPTCSIRGGVLAKANRARILENAGSVSSAIVLSPAA